MPSVLLDLLPHIIAYSPNVAYTLFHFERQTKRRLRLIEKQFDVFKHNRKPVPASKRGALDDAVRLLSITPDRHRNCWSKQYRKGVAELEDKVLKRV